MHSIDFEPEHEWHFEPDSNTHSNHRLVIAQEQKFIHLWGESGSEVDIVKLPEHKAYELFQFLQEFFECQ